MSEEGPAPGAAPGGRRRAASRTWRRVGLDLLKVAVAGAILALLFRRFRIGLDDVLESLGHRPAWLVASLLLEAGAVLFSIQRWRVLLAGQELDVPLGRAVRTFLVGRFLGTFTPTGVGLEAYKAYDVARYTGRPEASVSVVVIEKAVGSFFALGILVLATLPFFVSALDPSFLCAFGALFLALLALALVLLFRPGAFRRLLALPLPMKARLEGPLGRLVDAFGVYGRRRGSLLAAVLLGLASYLLWFLTYYTNGLALGAGLRLDEVLLVGPLTQVATAIPLSIAGVGLREGAFMGLLEALGATDGATSATRTAMMLSATMVAFVSISFNLVGALLFLTGRGEVRRDLAAMREPPPPRG